MKKITTFIYNKYIKEDLTYFKTIPYYFIKSAWFVRACLVYITSFILFPIVLVHMKFEEFIDELEELFYTIDISDYKLY